MTSRFLFVATLIVGVGCSSFATSNDGNQTKIVQKQDDVATQNSENSSAEYKDSAELKVNAKIPSLLGIAIVKGSEGIDVLDSKGKAKDTENDLSVEFEILGTEKNVNFKLLSPDGNGYKLKHGTKSDVIPLQITFRQNKGQGQELTDDGEVLIIRTSKSDKYTIIVAAETDARDLISTGDYSATLVATVAPAA